MKFKLSMILLFICASTALFGAQQDEAVLQEDFFENSPTYEKIQQLQQHINTFLNTVSNQETTQAIDQWLANFKYTCTPLNDGATTAFTPNARQERDVENNKSQRTCIEAVIQGLQLEKSVYESRNQNNDQDSVVIIDKLIADLTPLLTDIPGEDSRQTIIDEIRQQDLASRMERIVSKNDHFATFHVGSTLTQKYNEQGENQGFEETNAFLHFQWDNRNDWPGFDNPLPFGSGKILANMHSGIEIDFYSENIVNCEKIPASGSTTVPGGSSTDPGSQMPAEETACQDNSVDLTSFEFNDVSNTVKASVYAWLNVFQSESKSSEWSIGGRKGMETREKLKDNGDSINSVDTYGIRYIYNDWNDTDDKNGIYNSENQNGMPRIYFEYSKANYEDFNGIGSDNDRDLFIAAYRIKQDLPIYMSLIANTGTGPDEIAFTISYGLTTDAILGLFD